jgi:hypothetical protein
MTTTTGQQQPAGPRGPLEDGAALVTCGADGACAASNRPTRPCITRQIRAVNGSLDM